MGRRSLSVVEMNGRRARGLCPFCGEALGEHRDGLSKREAALTGLCQKCQDATYTPRAPNKLADRAEKKYLEQYDEQDTRP